MRNRIMKLNYRYTLLVSFLGLGLIYGIAYHSFLMHLLGHDLLSCLAQGLFFGLINYYMSTGIYKEYHELKDTNVLLNNKLNIDKLTGLLNRHALDLLYQEFRHEGIYSSIFIDIDNFKLFNDKYGHHVGDIVLQKVSNIIKNSVRTSDLVYRYGGEEIIILLYDCNKGTALEIAEKIRMRIIELENNPYPPVTISLGVASYPEDGTEVRDVIRASDHAMLKAKGLGKNQSCASSKEYNTKIIPQEF